MLKRESIINEISKRLESEINEVFETIGFTDENVTAYINNFFEEQGHRTNLQNFLKQNINIKHIAYIPFFSNTFSIQLIRVVRRYLSNLK